MKEVLKLQNEARDARPIGRFLLGIENHDTNVDIFSYARQFARQPGNFDKYKKKFVSVETNKDAMIDGRNTQLEFEIAKYSYIWKIIVAAEQHATEHIATNYIPHGGEQYELRCSASENTGYYREYNSQGGVIREREIRSDEQLRLLQGIVERLVAR